LSSEHLICPACGSHHGPDQQFCAQCAADLGAETSPLNPSRKIDPRYTHGDLVKVASGRNQADSEMLQGLLRNGGVPSMIQRTQGFDVPDFLASGPRDVMVPSSGVAAAREILGDMATGDLSAARPDPLKIAVGLALGLLVFAIIFAISQLL
jgi:hypothetical protein